MQPDILKQQVQEKIGLYLEGKGINPSRHFSCLNPGHADRHPSMHLDKNRLKVHCFACGTDYDVFDLIGLDFGLTEFREQFEKACEYFGINQSIATPKKASPFKGKTSAGASASVATYCQAAHVRITQTDYPQRRGLGPDTIARFSLGYDPHYTKGTPTPWQALIIPTGPESFTARNIDPQADKRSRFRKTGASPIFNAGALDTAAQPIFVVEGEMDAMSIVEVGGEAVALGSVANWQRFAQLAMRKRPTQPLLLALDQDTEGQKASLALSEALSDAGVAHYVVTLSDTHKDANEALQADREAFAATVAALSAMEEEAQAAQRKAYLQTSALHHLTSFLGGITQSVNTPFVPTGFAKLDAQLDGGLFEGLYIIGAISSLGKTSLMLQIADQIASQGTDMLVFSLEMARTELMAKSISRQTLLETLRQKGDPRHAKTARGITTGARYAGYNIFERTLIEDATKRYGDYAAHLFIHEGIGDIGAAQVREAVEAHIRFTGRAPVVLIDYIQILAPHSERASDKQNTDKAVLELKRISRDFKTPVIGISSFNRASYREAVTMEAFKESGAIEYSSDVLIGLQLKGAGKRDFDATQEKDKNPREIELVILKNRNGPTGRTIGFEYYPLFNFFREV